MLMIMICMPDTDCRHIIVRPGSIHRNILATGIALVLLTEGPLAYTQESASPVEEVIVVASQVPLTRERVTSAVTVLDEAALQGYGNQGLMEILRQQPSVSLSRNGGPGQTATLRIRGEEGYRTLTLIDGIRVSDPGSTQIATLPEHLLSQGVSRVEIMRGPQGLSYGADAGGVVMVQTLLPATGWQSALDIQTGRFGSQQYAASVATGGEQGAIAVQLTQLTSDGFNARSSDVLVQDDDGYRNFSGHLKARYQLSDAVQVDFLHRKTSAATEYDGCFLASTSDCRTDYSLQATRAGLVYEGAQSRHSFAISRTASDRDFFTQGTLGFATEGTLGRAEYLGSTNQFAGMTLVFGGDVEQVEYAPIERSNKGVFIEYLSNTGSAFTVNAGYRFDSNSESGTNTSTRLGAAYLWDSLAWGAVRFKAAYGSGFRAASPYEISYNAGSYAFPPAAGKALGMEHSDGYEAGVEWLANDRLTLEANYFRQTITDAIYFDLSNYSGYLQETGTSVSRGVELITRYELNEQFFAAANVSWNPTQRSNGLPRLRRPENLMNLALGWKNTTGRFQAQSSYRLVRNTLDEANNTILELDDFSVLDLNASVKMNKHLTAYSRIENLLNEKYEEVAGYNMPGASVHFGFNMTLAGM